MANVTWLPLESNPEALNNVNFSAERIRGGYCKFLRLCTENLFLLLSEKEETIFPPLVYASGEYLEKIGVNGAQCHDILGFDDDLLAMIPQPHLALIFCFPSDKAKDLLRPLYEGVKPNSAGDHVFFMKQEIENACGTFALFHALAQHIDKIQINENGPFATWYKQAKNLDSDARSKSLSQNQGLATAHQTCATSGETEANIEKVVYHFTCYANVNGTLYEFDSSMPAPRAIGKTTDEALLKDAGKVCQELMAKLNSSDFSAIALVGKEGKE